MHIAFPELAVPEGRSEKPPASVCQRYAIPSAGSKNECRYPRPPHRRVAWFSRLSVRCEVTCRNCSTYVSRPNSRIALPSSETGTPMIKSQVSGCACTCIQVISRLTQSTNNPLLKLNSNAGPEAFFRIEPRHYRPPQRHLLMAALRLSLLLLVGLLCPMAAVQRPELFPPVQCVAALC